MKSIVVVHVVSDMVVGGISSVLLDLLKNNYSSNFKYEIVNLSGKFDQEIIQRFESMNINVHNLYYKFENGYSLFDQFKKAFCISNYKRTNKSIIYFLRDLNPMILHFHTLPRELVLGKFVAQLIHCKLIYTDHLARIKFHEIKKISKYLISIPFRKFYSGYYVIAVGPAVTKYIENLHIKAVLVGLVTIPNKIENSNFRINYIEKREYKVVYVARISAVKGHFDLLSAWALLPMLNLHLYIVGPDELNGSLQLKLKNTKMLNKVSFTGALNNVAEFLKDMDIGVFPSHKEGLPIALLEKMQIGIPCIVSDIEELTSIVNDGLDGLVFKKGDVNDLANKIEKLAGDIKLRAKLGANAAKLIEENFVSKLGGIDKEYEAFYQQILYSK